MGNWGELFSRAFLGPFSSEQICWGTILSILGIGKSGRFQSEGQEGAPLVRLARCRSGTSWAGQAAASDKAQASALRARENSKLGRLVSQAAVNAIGPRGANNGLIGGRAVVAVAVACSARREGKATKLITNLH